MKQQIETLLNTILPGANAVVEVQAKEEFGHYTTAVAMRLAKEAKQNPRAVAEDIAAKLQAAAPARFFAKIEVAGPGFINMWIADEAVRAEFGKIAAEAEFGSAELLKGKRIMIEYTDPNPFKQFHIGHFMTNVIGESLARIHEAVGAEVLRVNYQGDVGLHVASSLWGMLQTAAEMPAETAPLAEKTAYLGRAYALGATAYKENPAAKAEIDAINKKTYDRSDSALNDLYDTGRRWSLEYFETLYARLGTKFVHYFFESEMAPEGVAIVKAHPGIFPESQGAVIFPGEQYGLHTRVFINKLGLPTYEAKELALNKKKFELYHPDLSIISTANEINEYFKVLLKAMELILPEVAAKTKHIGHGMLKLPGGKMSSRTGKVIVAAEFLEDIKAMVGEKIKDREGIAPEETENIKEQVALAAIRYSILRQGFGNDIIFDIEKSVAFHGDSGPYLQYTYARLKRVLLKAAEAGILSSPDATTAASGTATAANLAVLASLTTEHELRLMRKLFEFPDEVQKSAAELQTNNLAAYLFELANLANRFYEDEQILNDENADRRAARLMLAATAARILKKGMHLLGMNALDSI